MLASGLTGSSRMAAWLARSALEDGVVLRLERLGHDNRRASMRSRLTCLSVLGDECAADAEFAWNRLSGACHQHAFELAPNASEVRALLTQVQRLLEVSEAPARVEVEGREASRMRTTGLNDRPRY